VGEAIFDKMLHQGKVLNSMPLHDVLLDDQVGVIAEDPGSDVRQCIDGFSKPTMVDVGFESIDDITQRF